MEFPSLVVVVAATRPKDTVDLLTGDWASIGGGYRSYCDCSKETRIDFRCIMSPILELLFAKFLNKK